jgi:hypothetical protein
MSLGHQQVVVILAVTAGWLGSPVGAWGHGEKLYGVHWWDFDNGSQVGPGPTGGWSTETVITHSAPWWSAGYFQPLYQNVYNNHDAAIITRIDYNWGETVPSPANPDRAGWASAVLGVVNALGGQCRRWIIGNEPNIVGEGNGWANNQVTPAGYAAVYHEIRAAIKAARPQDEVLLAPPSPGGVIAGVRWMAGNDWLGATIDAVHALPGGAIDGFAIHAYGNPFTGAAAAVQSFHNDYASQLAVIDAHGEPSKPVYLTEWNRATSTTGNLAANEQVTADFIRGSLADVDAWNNTPGRHNIVSLSWFVNNKDYGDWNQYSLDWWKGQGNPAGHAGDLWTALIESGGYAAGLAGTRPLPPPSADFDGDADVDGADFLAWQRGRGRSTGATHAAGDGDHDGDVDGQDFAVWTASFGAVGISGVAFDAVPEPSAGMIAGVCAAVALHVTRRPRPRDSTIDRPASGTVRCSSKWRGAGFRARKGRGRDLSKNLKWNP